MELSRRALLGGIGLTFAGARALQAETLIAAKVQGVGVPKGVVQILYNENPLGPSPLALKAAQQYLTTANRYPMLGTVELTKTLHNIHGIPFNSPDNASNIGALLKSLGASPILLGVGSTEILRAITLAYGLEGGEFIEAALGYGAISGDGAELLPNRVKPVLVPLTPDFRHDWEGMLKAITPQTRVVTITNPNNPTGTALTFAEIQQVADRLDPKILLVVDEAYIDFATDPAVQTAIPLAKTRPNVLVTRTFSKIHGLAGIRIGYAIASLPVIQKIRPFTMGLIAHNTTAAVAARVALKDTRHLDQSLKLAVQAKQQLLTKLPAYGLTPVSSQASFVWVKVGEDCTPLVQRLQKQGVLIAAGQRWDEPNFVRISVGQPREMQALFAALG